MARDILGEPPPPARVPYFWSDQFGLKIQLFGRPEHADTLLPLHGDGLEGGAVRGTVVGLLADGRLVAVAGFGAARFVARYRALLLDGADGAAALELAKAHAAAAREYGARGRGSRGRDARARRQRKSLRSTAAAMSTPTAMRPYRILGSARRCCRLARAGVDQPLRAGPFAEHVEALGERVPRLLDLALDGVRVARHDAS